MKIHVTGAAGLIGSHLVRRLLDHGDDVVASDRRRTSSSLTTPRALAASIHATQATKMNCFSTRIWNL